MKSVSNEVRRARPLLGTFVEITAWGGSETKLHSAINRAFAAVCAVHRLMSFHDLQSDVSRINRDAFRRKVTVAPWTWRVLKYAQRLSRESDGAFDITVARLLAAWNFLPCSDSSLDPEATWYDLILTDARDVQFRRRLLVDLGGLAKGFAVDCAVAALKRAGVTQGVVNAGGDLRVFGPKPHVVHIRHPSDPGRIGKRLVLRESALATSALYFTRRVHDRKSPLIDGRTRRPVWGDVSLSVCADNCMTADALTKIVLVMGIGGPSDSEPAPGPFLSIKRRFLHIPYATTPGHDGSYQRLHQETPSGVHNRQCCLGDGSSYMWYDNCSIVTSAVTIDQPKELKCSTTHSKPRARTSLSRPKRR